MQVEVYTYSEGYFMYNCSRGGQIFMDGPYGSGFMGTYEVNASTGQIISGFVISPGSGYSILPSLRISDPACYCGSSIESVKIVSGGKGFTNTGTITAQPMGTVMAASFSATFTAVDGSLKSIAVQSPGYGFINQDIPWVFKCQNTSVSAPFFCDISVSPSLFAVIGKPGNVAGNSDMCLYFHWAAGAKIEKIYELTNISFVVRNGLVRSSTGNESLTGANVTANVSGSGVEIRNTKATGNVLNFVENSSFLLTFVGSTSTIRGDTTILDFYVRPNADLLPVNHIHILESCLSFTHLLDFASDSNLISWYADDDCAW